MSVADGLRVGIVGCGLIGAKRADALRVQDQLIATTTSSRTARSRSRSATTLERVGTSMSCSRYAPTR